MKSKLITFQLGILICLFAGWTMDTVAQEQSEETRDLIAEEIENLESFTEMKSHFRKRMSAYSKEFRAAKDNKAEREAIFENRPQASEYNDVLCKFLKEGSSEEANKVVSWWWHGDRGTRNGERMVDILLEHHVDAEMLEKFIPRFRKALPKEKAEHAYRTLIEKNSFDAVKASSMYSLQALLANKVETLKGEEAEAMQAEIKSLRESLRGEFADMVDIVGVSFVDRMKGAVFADQLKIGKPVPEIVGADLDGVDFKLSDYKGKVVVLDFWGHW